MNGGAYGLGQPKTLPVSDEKCIERGIAHLFKQVLAIECLAES
jgi:hypothetical protein